MSYVVRIVGGPSLGALPWSKTVEGLTLCMVGWNPLAMAL